MNVLFFRAGIEARVRGEGEGVGQVVAEARLHRHEVPLRLSSTSLNLQVNTFSWFIKMTCQGDSQRRIY